MFECKHTLTDPEQTEKKANEPVGVCLTVGGNALIPNQMVPKFDDTDIYMPLLQRPETIFGDLGYQIRNAFALALSVVIGEPGADAKDLTLSEGVSQERL